LTVENPTPDDVTYTVEVADDTGEVVFSSTEAVDAGAEVVMEATDLVVGSYTVTVTGNDSSEPVTATFEITEAEIRYAKLIGVASDRCMTVPGDSPDVGTQAILFDCDGEANQRFTVTAEGELRVFDDSLCLGTRDGSTGTGAAVETQECTGADTQRWEIEPDGSFRSAGADVCIDAWGASTANGTVLALWWCSAAANQRWMFDGDMEAPAVSLVSPTGDVSANEVTVKVDASDDVGLKRISADIYQSGELVESTHTDVADGEATATHEATVGLAGGEYEVRYSATDLSGRTSETNTFAFELTAQPEFTVEVWTQCVGPRVMLRTSVTNDDDEKVAVHLATSYGEKSWDEVNPGHAKSPRFMTKESAVSAGVVTVTVAGLTTGDNRTQEVPYDAARCG
jgi:hypothetical protein